MKGLKAFLSLALGFVLCIVMSGCAAKAPANGPGALHIALFTLSDGVLNISYRQLLVASGGQQPYTWTITSGSLPPGLSLSSDGIVSGTPVADPAHPFPYQYNFTTKVTDSQSPTAAYDTLNTSITVNPPLSFTPTSLPPGTVGTLYNQTITASNGLWPYNYTLTPTSSLPDGLTLTTNTNMTGGPNTATIMGTPTTAGVYTFTIEATDFDAEVATATFTIVVVGRLQGPYVVSFNGFEGGQPYYLVASFVADGMGNITSGVLDQNGPGANVYSAIPLVTGTNGSNYVLPNGSNFGSITFVTSIGTVTYHIVVDSSGTSRIILSDPNHSNVWGSGVVKVQSASQLLGGPINFSFGAFGNNAAGNRYGSAGMFALGTGSGNSQPVMGGEQDTNDDGTVGSKIAINGGTLTQLDPVSGRGTLSLATSSGTSHYVYYVVSGKELVGMGTDTGGPATLLSILEQQLPGASGSFSNMSLMGQSVIQIDGIFNNNGTPAPSAAEGVAAFDGNGNIKGPLAADGTQLPGYYTDESDAGTLTAVQYQTGTYNVDATCGPIQSPCGRVTVMLAGTQTPPVWYLVTPNQAFSIGTDAKVMQGSLQPQSVPMSGFTLPSLLGSYLGGTLTPVLSSVSNELDVAGTPPPGGIWQVTYDSNGPNGIMNQQMLTANYDCFGTIPACSDLGTYFGRFEITNQMDGKPLALFYLPGSGASGLTGNKGGIVGMNVGDVSSGGTTVTDPNPRLSSYTR